MHKPFLKMFWLFKCNHPVSRMRILGTMIREDEQRCCSLSTASISGGILSKPLCVYQKQSTPFNNKFGSGSQNSQTHPKTRSLAHSNASNTECRQIITQKQIFALSSYKLHGGAEHFHYIAV